MYDFAWGQFAIVGGVSAFFFAYGAKSNGLKLNLRTWSEIAQACAISVFLFAIMSEGRGCTPAASSDYYNELCIGDPQC
jgi:branched-subunit amino acid ABC-type transport system permease component